MDTNELTARLAQKEGHLRLLSGVLSNTIRVKAVQALRVANLELELNQLMQEGLNSNGISELRVELSRQHCFYTELAANVIRLQSEVEIAGREIENLKLLLRTTIGQKAQMNSYQSRKDEFDKGGGPSFSTFSCSSASGLHPTR